MVACSLHTDCQHCLVVGWWWSIGSTWVVSPCVGVGVGVGVGMGVGVGVGVGVGKDGEQRR